MDISFVVNASFCPGNGNKPLRGKVKDCPKLITGSNHVASLNAYAESVIEKFRTVQ